MNIDMQVCGLLIVAIITIFTKTQKTLGLFREKIFRWVVGMCALTLVLDILSLVFIGKLGIWNEHLINAACKVYVVSLTWTGWTAFVYMLLDSVSRGSHKRMLICTALLNWVVMILAFALPIDIVSKDGVTYTEGPSTIVVYISAAIYAGLILYARHYGKEVLNNRKKLGMILWVFFAVAAAGIQFFNKNLLLISFALAFGSLILFVLIENPEANLDKTLGCFNSYAKSLFVGSLLEEKADFSSMRISLKTNFFVTNPQEVTGPFLLKIANHLSKDDDIKLFKENDISFVIISKDKSKLRPIAEEFSKWIVEEGKNFSTNFSDLFLINILENPYALESKDEIDQLFAFARREKIYEYGSINVIDENVLRMFNVQKYLLSGENIPDEYKDEVERAALSEKKKKSLEMIDVIASEFDSVFYVDTDTGFITPYAMNNDVDYGFSEVFSSDVHFSDALKNFIEKFVFEDDRKNVLEKGTYDNILSALKETKSITFTFRGVVNGEARYYQIRFVKVGNESEAPSAFVFGLIDKDDEIKKQKAEEMEKEQYNAVVKALSSEYANIYFVQLDSNTFIPYSSSERVSDTVGIEAFSNIPFDVGAKTFVSSIVCNEDKERMLKVIETPYIKEQLKDKQYYTEIYKNEVSEYCEMKCVRVDEKESVSTVVLGFANKDDEIRDRMKQAQMLREALEKAEAANKSKTDFLFNMSHDIRTPMNAIMGFNKMAIRDIDSKEKVLDYLSKTQKSGDILLSLINDILDMSRIESGKVQLNEESFAVENIFTDIAPMMYELAKPKNIKVSFSFGEIKNKYILCDIMRTQRILVNIISNGVKYSKNEGYVKVNCSEIESEDSEKARYKFIIEDNGIGMSKEFQKHLFEHFSREENSTTSGIQGTGLGLALCKSLTEIMGGEITAESEQGVGSTFTVIIPFKKQEENAATAEENGNSDISDFELKGKRILLVEDNLLNREIACDILDEYGAIVEEAENGQIAVDMVKGNDDNYYDLILMDIQMPIMNGYEAATQIREFVPDRHIPIIALSANAFAEDKQKSLAAGMDDHIAKPINIDKLIAAIANVIK